MSWSTAQVAELAGTSLRAVRHYHSIGLLPEPERLANGWKRYDLEHLTRLCEIVRLRDLGFSLADIEDLVDGAPLTTALARLDRQLAESMARLQEAREEVAAMTRAVAPHPALPASLGIPEFDSLTDLDRSVLVLVSRVLDPPRLEEFVSMLRDAIAEPALQALDVLPPDASEADRAALADAMLEPTLRIRARHPTLADLARRGSDDPERALARMRAALEAGHNPAQADVLERLEALVDERLSSSAATPGRRSPSPCR